MKDFFLLFCQDQGCFLTTLCFWRRSYFLILQFQFFFNGVNFPSKSWNYQKTLFCTLPVLRSERDAQKRCRTEFEMSKKIMIVLILPSYDI